MNRSITAQPLTRESFAPFGEVIDVEGWADHYPINGGRCERYNALAAAEARGEDARVVLSIFRGTPYDLPLELTLMERHPFGSQAFMPLQPRPFLVVVAHDEHGAPGEPHAFLTAPGQGVNYPRNLWHAVLTPIGQPQDFLVVDRAGTERNLEEHVFDRPWTVMLDQTA